MPDKTTIRQVWGKQDVEFVFGHREAGMVMTSMGLGGDKGLEWVPTGDVVKVRVALQDLIILGAAAEAAMRAGTL